jgi:hypothetical protein
MTRSIHDNLVLGYAVDVERRTIVLHTEFRDRGEPFERTDVRFEGVLGYHFRDSLGGILFDIERVDFAELVARHADLFQAGAVRLAVPVVPRRPRVVRRVRGGERVPDRRLGRFRGLRRLQVDEARGRRRGGSRGRTRVAAGAHETYVLVRMRATA